MYELSHLTSLIQRDVFKIHHGLASVGASCFFMAE